VVIKSSKHGIVEVSIRKDGRNVRGSPFRISYVRHYCTINHMLQQIGSSGEEELQFNFPSGMDVDARNRIFVADSNNHRVQCLDSHGKFLFQFGSFGNGNGEFHYPKDVAFQSRLQRILVADSKNNRIQVFDSQGNFLFCFGTEGKGKGEFDEPAGIATDMNGKMYITDSENDRVQVFDEKGRYLRKLKPEGSSQRNPRGIGVLSGGEVVVSEDKRLSIFDPQGHLLRHIGEEKLRNPWWLFVDPQDNIFVADDFYGKESVFIFSKEGDELKRFGQGTFRCAWGVAMNREGLVFVSGQAMDGQWCIFVF